MCYSLIYIHCRVCDGGRLIPHPSQRPFLHPHAYRVGLTAEQHAYNIELTADQLALQLTQSARTGMIGLYPFIYGAETLRHARKSPSHVKPRLPFGSREAKAEPQPFIASLNTQV